MADKNYSGSDKPIKNSLLNIASTGFSLEDFSDARLLVPVSVQEEILKNLPEATAEIDLQSDDPSIEEKPSLMPESLPESLSSGDTFRPEREEKSTRDSSFLSFFSKAKDVKDSFQSLTSQTFAPSESKMSSQPPLDWQATEADRMSSIMMPTVFTPVVPQSVDLFVPGEIQLQTDMSPYPLESVSLESQPVSQQSISDTVGLPPTIFTPSLISQSSSIITNTATSSELGSFSSNDSKPVTLLQPSAPSLSQLEHPVAPGLQTSPVLTSPPIDLLTAAPLAPDAGPSATRSAPPQGTVNKYRLGSQRPQYAQYPGLIPTVPAVNNMGNLASQPLPSVVPTVPAQPYTANPASGAPSPLTPSFPQEYAGTGYVFGEPPPARGLNHPTPLQYTPVSYHWFFLKEVEGKGIWKPFSFLDSVALEDAYLNGSTGLVATDGGRYDVNVTQRLRTPVYWEDAATEVRRCSWFYKGPLDNRFIPYEEEFAQQIEDEFESAINTGVWQRRVELGGGEAIILHNANVIVHFCQAASPDEWGNLPESQLRPRVVKRGVDKSFLIEDGESAQIDHLVFLVHGIGAICDFKFRSIVEAVDDFRSLSTQLLHTHFTNALDKSLVGRIEFLPVCWHKALHGDCGVDRKLKPITLHSIPKLRHFTNDTLLDILFYTSPVYCQRIVNTVGNEINRMYNLFLSRNLDFDGSVSLSGHSLGSLILFDLLTHQPANIRVDSVSQKPSDNDENSNKSDDIPSLENSVDAENLSLTGSTGSSKMISYTIGQAGTGQPSISYPAFDFHPTCYFALGSPIAVFISVRGIDQLGQEFKLPTCGSFFNIFHPYDPVAYRMEPLIDPAFDKPAVVIPHHKGRKRFHLEIKDAMFRMGTDFKQTMVDTIKSTWKTVYHLASFGRTEDTSKANLEQEIDRVIEDELSRSDDNLNDSVGMDIPIGQLNGGRRIDYVLQEGPLESFNEYLFALSSHVCYWESEDTMLLIMKEIYQSMGVLPDRQSLTLVTPNNQTGTSVPGQLPGLNTQGSSPAQYNNGSSNHQSVMHINPTGYGEAESVTMYPTLPQMNSPSAVPPLNAPSVAQQTASVLYNPTVPPTSYYDNRHKFIFGFLKHSRE
ncbi:unnamed protein product [Allacma fusca]|uniref:Uncharacterized protein n=1 Tax=Allacma fusca TaxID=39272 RepID=A0A8J2PMT4_9HEXA|nr:unnamed protein product [Allacma fusca]